MNAFLAVNWSRMVVITEEGVEMPIEALIDEDGEETDEPSEAMAIVAAHPNGTWWSIDMADFERVSVH